MKQKNSLLVIGVFTLLVSGWFIVSYNGEAQDDTRKIKVMLRNVGHQLLLADEDSLSRVLPVRKKENGAYQILFENKIRITPEKLVSIVEKNVYLDSLPTYYLVEVKQCENREVAYSYQIKNKKETSIIPCKGRILPKDCYTITVFFTPKVVANKKPKFAYFSLIMGFILVFLGFILKNKKPLISDNYKSYKTIGTYQFDKDQHKLIKDDVEITLSKKECEILSLLIEKPNQTIKREELTKKVWEDNGVVVGRSLDTYISKLRKKLQEDQTIKIVNVHGVGYKLEV